MFTTRLKQNVAGMKEREQGFRFPRGANTGAIQGLTDLAAAVQLRLRVAFGLQAGSNPVQPGNWLTTQLASCPSFLFWDGPLCFGYRTA
jgi:hypothetical protein